MEALSLAADDHVFSVAASSTASLLACGSITGRVSCYCPSSEEGGKMREMFSIQQNRKSCRALCFSQKGERLYSAYKDKHLCCLSSESGQVLTRVLSAVNSPVNVMLLLSGRIVCGHDNGVVSVYDAGNLKSLGSLAVTEGEEYISGVCHTPSERQVVVTTGEGQIALIDTRELAVKKKFYSKSEILCVCGVRGEKKCVTGDTEGKLHFFSWLDSPLHAYAHLSCGSDTSIDSCVALPQDGVICVGCGDGVIRLVNSVSRQVTGVIGRKFKMQVDNLLISDTLEMLCCSAGNKVTLWSIASILAGVEDIERKRNCDKHEIVESNKRLRLDLSTADSEDVTSIESLQGHASVVKGLGKRKKQKKQRIQSRSERAQFFDGLL